MGTTHRAHIYNTCNQHFQFESITLHTQEMDTTHRKWIQPTGHTYITPATNVFWFSESITLHTQEMGTTQRAYITLGTQIAPEYNNLWKMKSIPLSINLK